jgi:hypothetical protein
VTKKPQPIKNILGYPNRVIHQLCQEINQQLTFLAQIKSALPKDLASHVSHCVLNGKKLIVYTDSASWASQLRFHDKTLLGAIRLPLTRTVSEIQIKIIGILVNGNAKLKSKPKLPSATVRDVVHNQALRTTDPELKQALEKLSSTLDRLHAKK